MLTAQNITPRQHSGGFSNTSSSITLGSPQLAQNHFQLVKARLLDINAWGEISNGMAEFQLTDPYGTEKTGHGVTFDLIRIKLPVPEPEDKFEWVRIEEILHQRELDSSSEILAMRVRPCESPVDGSEFTAHFFKKDATSTFIVRYDHDQIIAEVHGRNEKPNSSVPSILDTVRNLFVGIFAILGFSKVQWKMLTKGLVKA